MDALLIFEIWFPLQVELGKLEEGGKLAAQSWMKNPDDWASFRITMDCLLPSTAHPASKSASQVRLLPNQPPQRQEL